MRGPLDFDRTFVLGLTIGGRLWPLPGIRIHRLTVFETYTLGWLWFGLELIVFYDEPVRETPTMWETPWNPED
jgi:hypothetical protein